MGNEESNWDERFARQLEGATVLVALTRVGPDSRRSEQFFGTVMKVDPKEGVILRLEGLRAGEIIALPPHLSNFEPGQQQARYTLRETGEVVDSPDYTAQWTVGFESS
jgi:hypothetical protein